MKNHLFLYALLIITVLLMVGCTSGIPQLPIDNLQDDEADQENQDEATGVPRVVFIELFNTEGCASSKVVNPIMEEIVAEYENTVVILVEEAGWGIYSTEETSERFKWYFSDKSVLHTPSVCFNGLNQLFAEGFSLGGDGNSGNSGNEDVGDAGDVEADTTKPVITGSQAPLPNSLGWNNTDVTVSFSCADTGPVQSGIDINTVAGETVTAEGKDQSVTNTGTCIDVAGNIADSVTVSNINIDKTPPVVTITLPGTGEYVLNQSITATWSATDALSGVVSPVSGSVLIDTSSVGTKTFTLPAGTVTDKAGNSSLEVTISYSVIENTEEPVKWSGLGITIFVSEHTAKFNEYADTLLANGFTELRFSSDWNTWSTDQLRKSEIINLVTKGAQVIWVVQSGGVILTSSNWGDYTAAILAAAQWAQDNGVYEFQIGNEEELHNDDTTLTDAQVRDNLKALAIEVKEIFTNGNVSYSCAQNSVDSWIAIGKGDLDILAANIYKGGTTFNDDWKTCITNLVNAFGFDGTYITEFGPSWSSLDDYSTDEAIQATAVTEMIDYIKASGMTRAIFFCYNDAPWLSGFGAMKDDDTYRLLWDQALLNSGSVKFATVPAKTSTASLPNTIALLAKLPG